jgi:hypothetical protein
MIVFRGVFASGVFLLSWSGFLSILFGLSGLGLAAVFFPALGLAILATAAYWLGSSGRGWRPQLVLWLGLPSLLFGFFVLGIITSLIRQHTGGI